MSRPAPASPASPSPWLHPAPGYIPHCRTMSRPGPVHSRRQVEISAATWENIFREECEMGFPVAALFFHLEGLEYLGEASTGGECLQVVNGKCRLEMVRPVRHALTVADGRGRFRRLVRVRRYRLRIDRRDLGFVSQVGQWSPVVGHPDAERGVQRNAARKVGRAIFLSRPPCRPVPPPPAWRHVWNCCGREINGHILCLPMCTAGLSSACPRSTSGTGRA